MIAEVRELIDRYGLRPLPVEGTMYVETYRSEASSAMIGLYAVDPLSRSSFHSLLYDEVWHFYGGDPFRLILLYPDGTNEDVLMGRDALSGQHVQFTVPAGVWQAGELLPASRYALFGCTMAPPFTPDCFQASGAGALLARWSARTDDILRLTVPAGEPLRMPDPHA